MLINLILNTINQIFYDCIFINVNNVDTLAKNKIEFSIEGYSN
jgi:hypothetical protein